MLNSKKGERMKKILIAFLLVLTFGVSVTFLSKTVDKVEAETANGYRIEQVYQDKFNKNEMDPSWTVNDAELNLNYSGLHCISPVGYGSGPIINAVTLADKTRIDFTIYPQSGQQESNISFNIGMESPSTSQTEPYVDCKVQFWNDQLVFTDWQHNLAVNQEKINEHVLRGFNGLFSSLIRTDVSLFIERKSASSTQIYAEYTREGEVVYSSKDTPFELIDPRQPYGYCGFFWDVLEMDVTNFEVFNNDELVFSDDFSENTLTYPASDYNLGNFHVNNVLNESNVFISKVSSVLFDSKNDSILNKNVIKRIDNVTNPYNIKSSIKVNEIKEGSFYGFGFGLDDSDKSIDAKNAIGFIKKDNLTAEIVILKNGTIDRSNNYSIALSKISNSKYVDYSIRLYADNSVVLTIGGVSYKFTNIDFYGEIGIGIVNISGDESTNFELNFFSLERNVYNKYASEDGENNFAGIRTPDESDPYFTEPYINNQKYYLGTNVLLQEDWETGANNLIFTSANPYSSFGYTKEYSEWILEFDVDVLSRSQTQYFGVSFGRKSIVDVLTPASMSNSAILFRCDGAGDASALVAYGNNTKFDDGSTSKVCGVNVFSKKATKYHMMFVAKNRSVSVYFKDVNAPDSDLSILRAKVNDVNIDGFVSIVGTNNVSFMVSNYKIVNLSDECKEESKITLRESFDDPKNLSNKIVLDEMCDIVDGKLVMENSSLSTLNKKLYGILRFTAEEIENNFQIKFSKDKKVIFDIKNNKITVKEGTKTEDFIVDDINLKYIKSKRFEIIIQGNALSIGFKGFYDPQDKLSVPVVTYEFASELEEDNIQLLSNGRTVIDDLYLFSLDNSEECGTYNYEDDPNNKEVWIVKPDFDPSKVYDPNKVTEEEPTVDPVIKDEKGCKSSLSVLAISAMGLAIIPVMLIKKREEE